MFSFALLFLRQGLLFFLKNTDKIQIVQMYWVVVIIFYQSIWSFLTTQTQAYFLWYVHKSVVDAVRRRRKQRIHKSNFLFWAALEIAYSSGSVSFPTLKFCK